MPDTVFSLPDFKSESVGPDLSALQRALGERVLTDRFARGRYSTDASIYQMVPHGVVVPERLDDVRATLDFARLRALQCCREAAVPRNAARQ